MSNDLGVIDGADSKKCIHCDALISEGASKCPYCGGNTSPAVAAFSAILGGFLVAVFGMFIHPLAILAFPAGILIGVWAWRNI